MSGKLPPARAIRIGYRLGRWMRLLSLRGTLARKWQRAGGTPFEAR